MEFVPAAGALPTSSAIFVQIAAIKVEDIAANPIAAGFDFTFTTGATEPGGGIASRGDGDGAVALPGVVLGTGESGSSSEAGGATSDELALLRALGASGAALASPLAPSDAPTQEIVLSATSSDRAHSHAPWSDRPVATVLETLVPEPVRIALHGGDLWIHVEGAALRAPAESVLRFRLEPEAGAVPSAGLSGMLSDLDGDGRAELSLFPDQDALDASPLLHREDLVRRVGEALELRIPTRIALGGVPAGAFKFLLESFDVREGERSVAAAARLVLPY